MFAVLRTSGRRPGRLSALAGALGLTLALGLAQIDGPETPGEPSLAVDAVDASEAGTFATVAVVPYEVVDGLAVYDNDIILGTALEMETLSGVLPLAGPGGCPAGLSCGVIQTDARRAWPNGVVPYEIPAGTAEAAAVNIINAINHWEERTPIRFVQRTNEADYVSFQHTGSGFTCSSYLGRVGGPQAINYAGTGRGCLVHEIGHAVGLAHEHNRNDRDQFISIDFTNVAANVANQFDRAAFGTDVGAYDMASVMHYGPFAFAADPTRPVMTPKDPNVPLAALGGNGLLTASDVAAVEFLYGNTPAPATTAPPVTEAPPATESTAPATTAPTTATTLPPETVPPTLIEEPPLTVAPTTAPTTVPAEEVPPPVVAAGQAPVVTFVGLTDGATVPASINYGDLQISAHDPDVGTNNGDGIRWVSLVVSDADTGDFLGATREYEATYDWGLTLDAGRRYVLTAYAVSDLEAGGTWTKTTIVVTAG
ncbi:MAG: M12 family metallopeptidase [Actinomycetota bacterium]